MAAADNSCPRSRLVEEIGRLDPHQRQNLDLLGPALPLWGLVVRLCHELTNEENSRPWIDRRNDALARLVGDPTVDEVDGGTEFVDFLSYLGGIEETTAIEKIDELRQMTDETYLDASLGACAHRRLKAALQADSQIIALALRRGIRALLPYAVAVEDAATVLSPNQFDVLSADSGLYNAPALLVQVDARLARAFDVNLTESIAADVSNQGPLTLEEVEQSLEALRHHVSTKAQVRLADLSGALIRKINGARTAIAVSEDGISQAANSLVELIDRSLRSAFTKQEVLMWLNQNFPDESDVRRRTTEGKEVPTKRGEVLCFVYAGQRVRQQSPYHLLIVAVICHARTALERLKHADDGSAEDLAHVETLLRALESCFALAFTIGWAGLADEGPAT